MSTSVYAKGTSVSVERSEAELRSLLSKHGADALMVGHDASEGRAFVAFRIRGQAVRLDVPLPKLEDFRHYIHAAWGRRKRDDVETRKAHEQASRERWRALVLLTKAKLEAVQIGFSSIEREFMHDLLTPSGKTVGQLWRGGEMASILGETNVPLLPAAGG